MDKTLFIQQTKESLVSYFKSKERVIFAENKNRLIYEGDTDTAYNEIVRLYHLQGSIQFILKILVLIPKYLKYFIKIRWINLFTEK